MSKRIAGAVTLAADPCNTAKHDTRMARHNPRDVSFRAFRLEARNVLAQLHRVERGAPLGKKAEIRLLKELFDLVLRATDCGDSMIYTA